MRTPLKYETSLIRTLSRVSLLKTLSALPMLSTVFPSALCCHNQPACGSLSDVCWSLLVARSHSVGGWEGGGGVGCQKESKC